VTVIVILCSRGILQPGRLDLLCPAIPDAAMRIEERQLGSELSGEGAVPIVVRLAVNTVVDPKALQTGRENVLP